MHGDQFCNEIFVSDTNEHQSNDVIYWNLVYVVCLVCMCVGGRGGVNLDISVSGVFGQYEAGVDIFL